VNTPAPTHSLDDLRGRTFPGVPLAVIGFPIDHSLSPIMHNSALARMAEADARFANWRYHRFAIEPASLVEALPLFHAAGFAGINLTIPHKVEVLPLLRAIDPEAARFGAVNTLVREADGYRGYNTDGYGIEHAVREAFGRGLQGRNVLLLGAGGAARAVAVQCMQSGCARLVLVNRNPERLAELRARVQAAFPDRAPPETLAPDAAARARWCDFLVINVTSLGLKPADPAPIDFAALGEGTEVFDSTYGCVNALARGCAQRGIPYSDGLPMLVWQGARSLQIWTGVSDVPVATMERAARAELKQRENGE